MIILYCLRSSLPCQFIKPSEEGFPVDQLKPGRHEREDQGVLPQQWSEVRGGREKPLRSTVSMKDPNQGAYVITGYEVARFGSGQSNVAADFLFSNKCFIARPMT